MNYGWLCPLRDGLALYFPDSTLGVAHSAHENDKEECLTLFAPRLVTDDELKQVENNIHDVEFRVRASQYMRTAIFTPATQMLLGRFHFVLQIFGISSIITAHGRFSDVYEGIYWILLLPMFIAIARGLVATHGRETLAGLRKLYHSPIGAKVIVLPQLTKLAEMIDAEGYEIALQNIRDLGLPELRLFYSRATQYPRWEAKPPNPAGIIR